MDTATVGRALFYQKGQPANNCERRLIEAQRRQRALWLRCALLKTVRPTSGLALNGAAEIIATQQRTTVISIEKIIPAEESEHRVSCTQKEQAL